MYKAVCFGEVLWDNFKDGKRAGGAPMNVALHLHKQGIESHLISSTGSDASGEELLAILHSHKFPTTLIQKHSKLPTGMVEVFLDEHQHATYTIIEPVAWDEVFFSESLKNAVAEADVFIYGTLACRNKISRNTLFQLLTSAKLRVLDMNLRPPHVEPSLVKQLISSSDVLKINEDELAYLQILYQIDENEDADTAALDLKTGIDGDKDSEPREKILIKLSRLINTSLICLTLGDKGAMVLSEGKTFHHHGFKVKVSDTVGAGDAFLATFINGLLKRLPMDETLSKACAVGAFVASQKGANPDYNMENLNSESFYK